MNTVEVNVYRPLHAGLLGERVVVIDGRRDGMVLTSTATLDRDAPSFLLELARAFRIFGMRRTWHVPYLTESLRDYAAALQALGYTLPLTEGGWLTDDLDPCSPAQRADLRHEIDRVFGPGASDSQRFE